MRVSSLSASLLGLTIATGCSTDAPLETPKVELKCLEVIDVEKGQDACSTIIEECREIRASFPDLQDLEICKRNIPVLTTGLLCGMDLQSPKCKQAQSLFIDQQNRCNEIEKGIKDNPEKNGVHILLNQCMERVKTCVAKEGKLPCSP